MSCYPDLRAFSWLTEANRTPATLGAGDTADSVQGMGVSRSDFPKGSGEAGSMDLQRVM